jgi:bacteriocin-like protein
MADHKLDQGQAPASAPEGIEITTQELNEAELNQISGGTEQAQQNIQAEGQTSQQLLGNKYHITNAWPKK